ncbi:hypothetical protein Patl1_30499 [Pistacia atlantica]|uniref:Uncharacterized protein n=1 Tax=Pistacia atlantica TaxID=434234 RepID=A0ACC1ACH3_9ROSI|nr:hypothetical protein Patl1_30499 [Pistacia atlantica]
MVNCPFYFKIGACRHGDRRLRLHTKPSISPTLLLSNMYQRPDMITPGIDANGNSIEPPQDSAALRDFWKHCHTLRIKVFQMKLQDFYEDLFEELSKYGDIDSLNVCDNVADHMVGNVYVQFREEEYAARALKNLTGRFYAGHPIIVDFSPVTDFCEATCRQYEENTCNRGGYCNFMHLKRIGRGVNYLGDTDEGLAAAGAPIGIAAMKSVHMVGMVLAEGTMTGSAIMKVGAGGIGAQALAIGEGEAEVLVEDGIVVLSGKAVRRDEPKLSSGTRKEKCKKMLVKKILATTKIPKISMMVICKMVTNTVDISSSLRRIKETMYTDLLNSGVHFNPVM